MTQPPSPDANHVICTIATPSYADRFLALAESIAVSMPHVSFRILLLQDCPDTSQLKRLLADRIAPHHPSGDYRVMVLDDVAWGSFDPYAALGCYDILEFATSVKPSLLQTLLDQGAERVTYLDPDIIVFKDFSHFLDDETDVTLTPHFFTDIPNDFLHPDSYDILLAGRFNLGFISVRQSAKPLLDWWAGHLQFDCRHDVAHGRFTDQRIMAFAPVRSRVQELRSPGANVAYWNLHERAIHAARDGWEVEADGQRSPLLFFHFSGFSSSAELSLSNYANRPVLGKTVPFEFVAAYEEQLRIGHGESHVPISLGGVPEGGPLPTEWRVGFRADLEIHAKAGHSLKAVRNEWLKAVPALETTCISCGSVHHSLGDQARDLLVSWLLRPSLDGVPNGIAAFFRQPDHLYGYSPQVQMEWGQTEFPTASNAPSWMNELVVEASAKTAERCSPIVVSGYLAFPAGMGEIARSTVVILEDKGITPALNCKSAPLLSFECLSRLLFRWNVPPAKFASHLAFVNADRWELFVTSDRVDLDQQHVEAIWAWELEEISEQMRSAFTQFPPARLNALSQWGANAMRSHLGIDVGRLAPLSSARVSKFTSSPSGNLAGLPSSYVLASFDAKSIIDRKNPQGVLEVWKRIEQHFPNVWLVLKTVDFSSRANASLSSHLRDSPRTLLLDEALSDEDHMNLVKGCSVSVSLHRSEGLGLGPIEAALAAKPVVFTNYGGMVEFFDETSYPVRFSMARVDLAEHDTGPYPPDALWADPDLGDAEVQLTLALQRLDSPEGFDLVARSQRTVASNVARAQEEIISAARNAVRNQQRRCEDEQRALELAEQAALIALQQSELPVTPPRPSAPARMAVRVYKSIPAPLRALPHRLLSRLSTLARVSSTAD